jgi:hypothetical protein
VSDISEENIITIFRVEEKGKQKRTMRRKAQLSLLGLPHVFLLVFCLSYWTMKMEGISCYETQGSLRTIRRYNPEDHFSSSTGRRHLWRTVASVEHMPISKFLAN